MRTRLQNNRVLAMASIASSIPDANEIMEDSETRVDPAETATGVPPFGDNVSFNVRLYTHNYIYIYTYVSYPHSHIYIYICISIFTYRRARRSVYTQDCKCICTSTNIYIYIYNLHTHNSYARALI